MTRFLCHLWFLTSPSNFSTWHLHTSVLTGHGCSRLSSILSSSVHLDASLTMDFRPSSSAVSSNSRTIFITRASLPRSFTAILIFVALCSISTDLPPLLLGRYNSAFKPLGYLPPLFPDNVPVTYNCCVRGISKKWQRKLTSGRHTVLVRQRAWPDHRHTPQVFPRWTL